MATVREILGSIERDGSPLNNFNQLNIETKNGVKFILSIQGSTHHYCFPRKDLQTPLDYEELEVAILRADRGSFINPKDLGFGFSTPECDDVCSRVSLETIISGIESFLLNGGKILLCTN